MTLLIAAYNEQEIVAEKMANCRALEYPAGKLRITWITDGSTDRTVELLAAYPDATVLHDPRRGGKTAALNRALEHIRTPLVIFTDANTMLNPEAVTEIVRCFEDPFISHLTIQCQPVAILVIGHPQPVFIYMIVNIIYPLVHTFP